MTPITHPCMPLHTPVHPRACPGALPRSALLLAFAHPCIRPCVLPVNTLDNKHYQQLAPLRMPGAHAHTY